MNPSIPIYESISEEEICSYIPHEIMKQHYLIYDQCDLNSYETILNKGYRRFGKFFFRHHCNNCKKCRSIRVINNLFKPSKSQRKVLNKNDGIKIKLSRPTISIEHMELFDKYHKFRKETRGWSEKNTTPEDYFSSFIDGHEDYGYEMQYFFENKLIAIGLIDILKESTSSVYFYYDPDWQKKSLGTYSLLKEIELSKQQNKKYSHLGYWIKENQSMKYKSNFKPHELLANHPSFEEQSIWSEIS
ncbi:MAG: arginyltransferase [Planctomycetota bacterium]|nr:MAG: arginyltransferase [Planctomycetota bacterium]